MEDPKYKLVDRLFSVLALHPQRENSVVQGGHYNVSFNVEMCFSSPQLWVMLAV